MYNLNYSYLSDLNCDTSRSARDISASAMFVAIAGNDYTTPITSVTNRFVDWFFKATNANIPLLDVTFHNLFLKNRPLTAYTDTSLRTYGEVTAAISAQLTQIKTAMQTKLAATISALNAESVIPVGTVVLNKSIPGSGLWTTVNDRLIIESAGTTGLIPDTDRALTSCILSSNGVTPKHMHEVTLSPTSKSITGTVTTTINGLGGFPAGGYVAYKSTDADDLNAEIVTAWDGWDDNDAMDSSLSAVSAAYNTMISVDAAGTAGQSKTVNVAPAINQVNAAIYIKTA